MLVVVRETRKRKNPRVSSGRAESIGGLTTTRHFHEEERYCLRRLEASSSWWGHLNLQTREEKKSGLVLRKGGASDRDTL